MLQQRQHFTDVGDFFVNHQDERVIQFSAHVVSVGNKVRRQVTAIKLHTFNNVQFVLQALAFFNGDNAFFTNFLHRFSNDRANVVVAVGRNGANLGNRLVVFTRNRHSLDFGNSSYNSLVDAALEVHRVHAGRNGFQAFFQNRLSQNGCRSGTVTGFVRSFGSNFLHHLRAHVFKAIFQFNFLGNRYTVFGDGRRAERFVDYDVTAFGAKRYFYCVCQGVYAFQHFLTGAVSEFDVFCSHVLNPFPN